MTITHDKEARETYESDFARLFDGTNKNFHTVGEYNRLFLVTQENWLNDLLASRGHLFLNEVYDALGFSRISQGQLVGWFYADGRTIKLRLTYHENGSILIEPNVINSDVMYYKI